MAKTVLEKEEEVMELTWRYQGKINSIIDHKTESEVVYSTTKTSCYKESKKEIYLGTNHDELSLFHEMGHEIFARLGKPYLPVYQLAMHGAEYMEDETAEEVKAYLDLLKEEYHLTVNQMIPLSDYWVMMVEEPIYPYRGHYGGYVKKFSVNSRIVENETFANVFAQLGAGNWRSIQMLMDIAPKFFYACLDLIDKAMHMKNIEK